MVGSIIVVSPTQLVRDGEGGMSRASTSPRLKQPEAAHIQPPTMEIFSGGMQRIFPPRKRAVNGEIEAAISSSRRPWPRR